jgi:hypothetical protein
MKYEMIQLRKGVFELDFVKTEGGNNYTCVTNLANKLGMNVQSVNRIINTNEILRDASTKLSMRDSKNRINRMIFIHSDHFLYFLSKIEGLKGAAIAPDFVKNLIIMYPLFIKELQRRAQFLFERAEKNQVAQLRINELEEQRREISAEITQLRNEMSLRNIEDVTYNTYTDGSVQPTLELNDQFYRNVIEIEAEIVTEND